MGLTKAQEALITKARTAGAGELGVSLDDATCAYLAARIIFDMGLEAHFPEWSVPPLPFFSPAALRAQPPPHIDFLSLFERLLAQLEDADTYFYCLAALHKARLKFERIWQVQAFPTIEQVGPRGLLEYGLLSTGALTSLLFWRKWLFDIDNRAAQETGYVFEPIIAHAIGGVPYSASKSPIRREGARGTGRQVDCIRGDKAYEFKLRVTTAASGQGRWREELRFPEDCCASGYVPVLLVLDSTPNPKLIELQQAFLAQAGEVYVGQAAWQHLAAAAGSTMAIFLQRYVHEPIHTLLAESSVPIAPLSLSLGDDQLMLTIGDEQRIIRRDTSLAIDSGSDALPEDIDEL